MATQAPSDGPTKKTIFKKPAWLRNKQPPAGSAKNEASPDTTNTSDAVDIFSRSNDTHAAILAERTQKERKFKEKKESKTAKREESRVVQVGSRALTRNSTGRTD
jgi:hypothetical protein